MSITMDFKYLLIIGFYLGLYWLISSYFIAPSPQIEKVVSKNRFKSTDPIKMLTQAVQRQLYDYIKISETKENITKSYLLTERMDMTPKDFITYNYAQSIVILLFGTVICLCARSFIPFFLFVFLAVLNYRQQEQKLASKLTKTKSEIEKDLSKFCNTLAIKVQSTNNVENILASYLPIANKTMRQQLEITLADIRTGGVHTALTRLEERVPSRHLIEITRGLKAVANGDDQRLYFEIKRSELEKEHKAILEKEVEKRSGKLLPYQIAIVALFILCILYPMGMTVLKNAAGIFTPL